MAVLDDNDQRFPLHLEEGHEPSTNNGMVFGYSVGPAGLNPATDVLSLVVDTIWDNLKKCIATPKTDLGMDDFLSTSGSL